MANKMTMCTFKSGCFHIENYCFLSFFLIGCSEGSHEVRLLSHLFYIGKSQVTNYFAHCSIAKFELLNCCAKRKLSGGHFQSVLSYEMSCRDLHRQLNFVDVVKYACWRPSTELTRSEKYDGHDHMNCNAALVWINVQGLLIRLEFTNIGLQHDRHIFNSSEPLQNPSLYFTDDECVIGDTGFIGLRLVVCP